MGRRPHGHPDRWCVMQPVSDRWLPTLASSHGMTVDVSLSYGGEIIAERIPIVGGSVTVDRGSAVRRVLSLTIADPADMPLTETDAYSPYGHRLHVRRGIRYLDGSVETVSLGHFVVESVAGDAHTGPLTITAPGLERVVQDEPLEAPWTATPAITHAGAIRTLIQAADPSASLVDTSTLGATLCATTTWDAGADRWAACQQIARAIGAECYVDANGTYRLADVGGPLDTPPVWTVAAGAEGVLVSATRTVSAEGVFNRVVCRGSNVADGIPPVSGTATITDPGDPLRYGGPVGRRTYTFESQMVTSTIQAQAAANAELRRRRAPNTSVSLSTVPNAALEAGDVIRTVYGVDHAPPELHVVQSFTVPLAEDDGAFTLNTASGREDVNA